MASGVEFEEDQFRYGAPRSMGGTPQIPGYNKPNFAASEPKMVRWLMNHGFANSPKAAQIILVGVVVINIVITYIVIKYLL